MDDKEITHDKKSSNAIRSKVPNLSNNIQFK